MQHLISKFSERSFDLSKSSYPTNLGIDPYKLIEKEIDNMNQSIVENVENKHPVLSAMAKYYFKSQGKQFRPVTVLLTAKAASPNAQISNKQIKLAEIIQMIHTASLVHDDVIDKADTRRGVESINSKYGDKLSVLAGWNLSQTKTNKSFFFPRFLIKFIFFIIKGDYLLARASVTLARLENHEVTELLSNVIAELVEGEFMQLKAQKSNFDYYLKKTYLKTASLIANATRSAAILAGCQRDVVDNATEYGKNLGMAFQVRHILIADYIVLQYSQINRNKS